MDTEADTKSKANGRSAGTTAPLYAAASLAELVPLDAGALAMLYEDGDVPDLAALRGDLRGRLLVWPAVRGLAGKALRAIASSQRFPWRGKSFTPGDGATGTGANRLFFDRGERGKLFRFTTSVGRSRAGDFDALQIDYDQPGNPFFVRRIKDELRQIGRGLYLGQAYALVGGSARLFVYFGLSA